MSSNTDIIGVVQGTIDLVASIIPSMRNNRIKRDKIFLELLLEYIPQIKMQVERFQEMYDLSEVLALSGRSPWVNTCTYYPGREPWQATYEQKSALVKATELARELRQKLADRGWKYLRIRECENDLILNPFPERPEIDGALAYYNSLMVTFEDRVKSLCIVAA